VAAGSSPETDWMRSNSLRKSEIGIDCVSRRAK